MDQPREIELKLEFDPADRDRLDAATAFAGADANVEYLVATYFDTPDREVREAGYALRIRREGGTQVQTVKSEGAAAGLFVRGEWEHDVRGDRPVLDARSGPLAQIVGRDAVARLERVFVTDVRRATRALDAGGARFACAIDQGEVRAGDRRLSLCEVELELESGSAQALFDVARRLDEAAPLRLSALSKAERGYLLAEGEVDLPARSEPITIDPNCTPSEAFRVIARSCLKQFRCNEDIVLRTGAPEPLHQARVGLRRLRTAFSLFKPLIAGDDRGDLLRVELRWLAAELGDVRNLDALIERGSHTLRERLLVARDSCFDHVRTELASARARLLMLDLTEWLSFGDWCSAPADTAILHGDIEPFAADLLEQRRRQLKRRGKGLAGLDDQHRHKARIATKKLRYATQFFASLYRTGKARRRYEPFLEALETLQDKLGELNDLVVAPRILASLGIDAKPPGSGKREQLLRQAEQAYDALIDAKRFWR